MGLFYVMVKYSLFIINLCFTLSSVAIIVIGVLSRRREIFEDYEDNSLEETLETIAIGLIAFGCVVFLFALSGSIGAIMEINNLLITFIVLMAFIVTAETYLLIVWEKDINFIKNEMIANLNKHFDDPGDNSTFHYIEAWMHCCGTTGPDSYYYEELPKSCCPEEVNVENECLLEDAYSVGCVEMIQILIRGMTDNLKTFLICVISFQGLEIIGSIYLTVAIDARRRQAEAAQTARLVGAASRCNKTQSVSFDPNV